MVLSQYKAKGLRSSRKRIQQQQAQVPNMELTPQLPYQVTDSVKVTPLHYQAYGFNGDHSRFTFRSDTICGFVPMATK